MARSRAGVALVGVVVLAGLAGCGALFGGDATAGSTPTVTPAPVPTTETPVETPTPTPTPSPTPVTTPTPATPSGDAPGDRQPRYFSLRPNCERPPGLVVHIQVAALANNDPATNEGINTTWRFAAPESRELTGPYPEFVELITNRYRPLLDAEQVTYGPLDRVGGNASQRVTVDTGDGENYTYEWILDRQQGGEYDGCWMTAGVLGPI